MRRIMLTALALGSLVTLSARGDIIIDFEALKHVDTKVVSIGNTYSEKGFTLTETGDNGFATFGTLERRFSGSTALFDETAGGITTLVKDGGGSFNLKSIDLAELNGNGAVSVTFTAVQNGGGTASQTFTTDGIAFGAETFAFSSAFGAITSLSFVQVSPYHQFDNIRFGTLSAVPEPSSLAMLGIAAAAGLVAIRRRKRIA